MHNIWKFQALDPKSLVFLRNCCSLTASQMLYKIYYFSGRDEKKLKIVEQYLKVSQMFRDFNDSSQDPVFSQVRPQLPECFSRSISS